LSGSARRLHGERLMTQTPNTEAPPAPDPVLHRPEKSDRPPQAASAQQRDAEAPDSVLGDQVVLGPAPIGPVPNTASDQPPASPSGPGGTPPTVV
jgi:hypothetical protein